MVINDKLPKISGEQTDEFGRLSSALRIGLILSSPSPHQVDLLNAVSRRCDVDAFAAFVNSHNPSRHWGRPTPNLPWENLPTATPQLLRGRLYSWIAKRPADIWVLSSVYTSPVTQLLARILRSQKKPFVFLGEPPQPRTGLRAVIQRKLMMSVVQRADAVIGTGQDAARRYRELVQERKPVTSIPYVVDVTSQLSLPLVAAPAANEPYRFVASAQLIHRKGLDVLIKACERLPRTGWSLEIFGDGPLRQTLQTQSAKTKRPIFFRGQLPYSEKDNVFRGRHCFVFSTRWDGWGMVLPEALAMGLPVISTDQAMSAHDFIRDGENGQIGPANDEEFLAMAMTKAIATRDSLSIQSAAAKNSLKNYTPDIEAERMVEFLADVSAKAA